MRKKLLLTGATGTIGAPLLRYLRTQHPSLPIRIANDTRPESFEHAEWIPTDFRSNAVDYDRLVDGCDIIYHLAAETTHLHKSFFPVNVVATRELAAAAERSGTVQHFLYTSTCLAYGLPKTQIVPDGLSLSSPPWLPHREPLRDYGISKYDSEKQIEIVAKRVKYKILRPVNISSSARIAEVFNNLSGLQRIWWIHRVWHHIAVEDAVPAFAEFMRPDLWEQSSNICYYNFADDSNELRVWDYFYPKKRGLLRNFTTSVFPLIDNVKDAAKYRYIRPAWNYPSTTYESVELKKIGINIQNFLSRKLQEEKLC